MPCTPNLLVIGILYPYYENLSISIIAKDAAVRLFSKAFALVGMRQYRQNSLSIDMQKK
jgi:hypothetical protein